MDLAEFRASLNAAAPPHAQPALQALWFAANGDWEKAHELVQPGGSDLNWVHAYLHRVEGDPSNAAYWYRNAGRAPTNKSLDEEWDEIARALLAAG